MRVLLTSYHVLDTNYKDYINYTNEENEKELHISNREIIKSDSNNLDYICIPLFEHDNIENFLDIDKNIFNPGYNLKDKQIQIYKYDLTLSLGKIINIKDKKEIFYDCNTEAGWSGGPILTKDNKVIGIHKGTDNKEKLNYGICIKNIIEDIKDQIQKLKDGNEKM
jgi:V8-like Glu-specific endopeptidase